MTRIVCIALMFVMLPASLAAAWYFQTLWALLAVAALLLVFAGATSRLIVGLWRGALIDARNKVSLSRFQTLLWTILIVSAFLVSAVYNVRTKQADPLKIELPPELLILLGISVTSLVGAGLIKREKGQTKPEKSTSEVALGKAHNTGRIVEMGTQLMTAEEDATNSTEYRVIAKGVLAANDTPQQSSWLDLFGGEEIGSIGRLDLGKIQMFYFTVIVVLAYAVAVASLLSTGSGKVAALPGLNEGVIALLGISHAAYLTNKIVPSTPTAARPSQPTPG